METTLPHAQPPAAPNAAPAAAVGGRRPDVRSTLRTLQAPAVTIRELHAGDAAALAALLTTETVVRFIYPPPTDPAGFARFIEWTRAEQAGGRQVTFAIVPHGQDTAVGIIQVRQCDSDFTRAEWGFVLAERYWGTGLFMASARVVLQYLFECVGVQRLEARSVALNGRGNGVLEKLGGVREGALRRAFCKHDKFFDEVLWTIHAADWLAGRGRQVAQPH
jgi:RimJ/RimL family protein N-acetyltransferase